VRSLQGRLILAFAAVALVSIGAVAAFTSSAIRTEFDRYLLGGAVLGPPPGVQPPPGVEAPLHLQDPRMRTMMRRIMGAPELRFLWALRRATWLSAVGGIIAAVLLGVVVARRMTAPLRQMSAAAARIGQGDLAQEVPVPSDDELGGMARAFNAMAVDLQRLDESRRNLSADIAHELRTPLSIVQANLEGMLDGLVEASPDRLAALHTHIRLLARLVDDLRDLSLAQAGRLPLDRRPVDLAALLSEAASTAAPYAAEKQVAVEVRIGSALPSPVADRERLMQVAYNLVDNAVRHTPAGGTVTLGAEERRNGVCVWVQDTGPGIPPEERERIFDRFYRMDGSRSRASGGAGLGLAIVKALVEAHGGRVSVADRPGGGATFEVMLPVSP